ncbi:sensor histidine kinase [Saccharibacillus sp. JS10]|uniref:sensor histidine kinase n=1 Tax=Saccharibacillus sp. JS10 TaxID=2950552 RepID=UPI00210B24B6|nr:histidine kinase [Saccharibacillus sp. JS10]MCQ4085299.1 histidine kinase [Saccharibacillus sp. JS10]
MMSDKQIKWLILFLPTIVVGIWEYVRHQFLMPVLSMNAGNVLTPVLVFVVSITLLRRLFARLERIQRELEQARAVKANLEAREELARELHDGMAQSLFLLSVKIDRMEKGAQDSGLGNELGAIRKTVHEVNRYVRQALSNLREPKPNSVFPNPGFSQETSQAPEIATSDEVELPAVAEESMAARVERLAEEAMIKVKVHWTLPDEQLGSREKVELLACVREAVINVRKHASADSAEVIGQSMANGWSVEIVDNGKGFDDDPLSVPGRYGLRIIADRAQEMGWDFIWDSKQGRTSVKLLRKEERS